jgi:hypothetical protein
MFRSVDCCKDSDRRCGAHPCPLRARARQEKEKQWPPSGEGADLPYPNRLNPITEVAVMAQRSRRPVRPMVLVRDAIFDMMKKSTALFQCGMSRSDGGGVHSLKYSPAKPLLRTGLHPRGRPPLSLSQVRQTIGVRHRLSSRMFLEPSKRFPHTRERCPSVSLAEMPSFWEGFADFSVLLPQSK